MDKVNKARRQVGLWRTTTAILGLVTSGLIVAVVLLATKQPAQPVSTTPACGATPSSRRNRNSVDLSEPSSPGPFHDLTKHEMRQVRAFLERHPTIQATPAESASVDKSYIYMMDLYPAKKAEVLAYLDDGEAQPERLARVIMYRGDQNPPMVEEYACGPLPNVARCDLIVNDKRRNPVEYSLRPIGLLEYKAIYETVLTEVDTKVRVFVLFLFSCCCYLSLLKNK